MLEPPARKRLVLIVRRMLLVLPALDSAWGEGGSRGDGRTEGLQVLLDIAFYVIEVSFVVSSYYANSTGCVHAYPLSAHLSLPWLREIPTLVFHQH